MRMDILEAFIMVLVLGLLVLFALAVKERRLYRSLFYFLGASADLFFILAALGFMALGALILLINVGVVVSYILVLMIIGETVDIE